MISTLFQIVFTKKVNFIGEITKILRTSFEEIYLEKTEDDLKDYIQIKYIYVISNKRFLIGFNIDFEDIETDIDSAIKTFCKNIQENENCEFIVKFYDDNLLSNLKTLYDEVFEIEMKLREIITFIFISTYENDYYNLLDFQKINPKIKRVKKQGIPDFLKDRFQNEFFFLTFSDYRSLKVPDIIKSSTVINLLAENNKTTKTLKRSILNLGVFKEEKSKYVDFLNSIEEDLESIETIRNCVAHNRQPTDEEIQNYEKARDNLNQKMESFTQDLLITEE
jgi:hypothetical protein